MPKPPSGATLGDMSGFSKEPVHNIDVPKMTVVMKNLAILQRLRFKALKSEGFSNFQAIELCKDIFPLDGKKKK